MKTPIKVSFEQKIAMSKPAQDLLKMGRNRGWIFTVLCIAPMPKHVIELPEWRIVPAQQDESLIPTRTIERVRAIFASGIPIKGFLLVHEKPKLLPAPDEEPDVIEGEFRELKSKELSIDVSNILETTVNTGLKVVGSVAVAVAAIAAFVIPAVFTLGSALLLDPLLIAIVRDPILGDVWVEVDRWAE